MSSYNMPGMCRFSCVCASPVIIIKNYFDLDAAAYIIGISVKSWGSSVFLVLMEGVGDR